MLFAAAVLASLAPQGVADAPRQAVWWSLAPIEAPAVPTGDAPWIRNPVDAFLWRALEREGLTPAAEADRRTLIRRVTFDLHGLPPMPTEIDAFVADPSDRAYEDLIDRLLASPRYGERWGRHWLDVVHYGETHGYDKDKLRPHAWPYRDYVIDAFNADKPYARFVHEQLAADALFPLDSDRVVALGFIAAGPWDFVGHVELREGTKDKAITRSLDRDDMVMATMATFASTTAHCARCHDHKFDPIPQRDYYRLQAVFAGVERANRRYEEPRTAMRRQVLAGEGQRLRVRRAELDARIARATSPDLAALDAECGSIERALAKPHAPDATESATAPGPSLGYHSAIAASPDSRKWVQVDLGSSRAIDAVVLFPAHEAFGGHPGPGFGFPPRFSVAVADDAAFSHPRILADHTDHDFPHPGNDPYSIAVADLRARFVRVTATRLWKRAGKDWIFALGELAVLRGGQNIAANAPVTAADSIEAAPRWARAHLTDGAANWKTLAVARAAAAAAPRSRQRRALIALRARRTELIEKALDSGLRSELEALTAAEEDLARRTAELPEPRQVYAATREFKAEGNFRPHDEPWPIHVLHRGDVERPGEQVAAGALSSLPLLEEHFANLPADAEGARRAALAHWITDPRNPLTWRSIVNRVWQYHFGRGLVETPNDFGKMGARPSHPELLDWLATWFRDGGGSFKQLHRLLLTSAAYRQSSTAAVTDDTENRWWSRMSRRRLEAEAVRDAVLAVSGQLDLTVGGPSARWFAFTDDHSPHYDYRAFDVDDPQARRRSVYRLLVRSVADPFMESLDCADASLLTPRRFTTLTAPQALALLNNPFMLRQAGHFAARLEAAAASTDARLTLAYRLALGRAPDPEEARQLAALTRQHGLANTCRLLFNLNEFVFID